MTRYITTLKRQGACKEATDWLENEGFKTLDEAWLVCERGDWMLWLAGKLSGEPGSEKRRKLVLAACECARLALPLITVGETRPLKAIEMAEAWARGDEGITLPMVRDAANAANYAAANAANAAYAANYAAAYAAANAANAALKRCADIVREYYPIAPRRINK